VRMAGSRRGAGAGFSAAAAFAAEAPPAPPITSPAVSALLAARVRPGSVVLFDLDDTLVVATEVTRSEPLVRTHRGYATVIQVGPVSCFVAVRAFTLASIALLHEAGMRVGFWSAGSPLYVSAVAERLVDAVRQMQLLRHARRGGPGPNLFAPAAVMALDQQAMVWVHDVGLERGAVAGAGDAAYLAPRRYRQLASAPLALKHVPSVCRHHPSLAPSLPHILLIDNLPHDPAHTWHVADFLPEREDRDLMHIARRILKAQRGER
jgi:hypothetical protein